MRNLLKALSISLVLSFAVMTCVPVNAAEYVTSSNSQSDIQAAQPDLSIQPDKKKLETPAEKPDLADKPDLAEKPDLKEIKLTKKQQKELAGLSKDIMEKQKKLVSKYVKYGILSEEKGNKILSHMEQRYVELEKNGFIPNWKKHHK